MTTAETVAFTCRLNLPYQRPPLALTANARPHWAARAKATRQVRADVVTLAKQAGLHKMGACAHLDVTLVWAPGDRRRRDSPNLAPLAKAIVDALARGPRKDLIGLDLVPDDTDEWVTQHPPRLLPPPDRGMWVDLVLTFVRKPDFEETA